ncbi:zinc carboxypeptidase family protein (macronuclear) [Tetrahymena thermophila SB210]|uniref:Zinc carboxypeptidase family protein n=1 Tax=Tetrahymena thermophila (strain SB210) TaxID=312017 RepID=I7LW86_TETTS|nr:zinc carboxypeptidase family protein [Tetrahymena thermophila SB210]EAS01158.2 zinc carboxypeptidase family protein [Tetrahymena thermophila SB210]|eukprot:XP_001021403.2 zinc carboxypeptidase family protein [Tetrahymena thermophila SB210]
MIKLARFLVILCIFSVSFSQEQNQFKLEEFIRDLKTPNNWGKVEGYLDNGPMNGYFDYNTTMEIYFKASQAFPELVKQPIEIGKSFLNNSMWAIALTLKTDDLNEQQSILIDSLHHGREMLSLSMQIYTFAKLISDYSSRYQDTLNLLTASVVWFIPAVNVDGLIKVKDIINRAERDSVRKNFNRTSACQFNFGGVDLNRNYDEHFALDSKGSSSYECSEDYRGPHAFSEKETQAMKKFVEDRPNLKIAFNFHSYGNMWIRPINYLADRENKELQKMIREYHIYQEFDEEAKFSEDAKKGNAIMVLQGDYLANGEATDWMLLKKKIIAMSPEIGDESTTFFPPQQIILKNLQDNYPPVNYMMQKILFYPKLQGTQFLNQSQRNRFISKYNLKTIIKNSKLKVITFEIFNSGIGDILQEHQESAFIELGFQRDFTKQQINNSSFVNMTNQDQNDTSQQAGTKFHYFHVQNVFFVDYSEDYRFQKIQEQGIDEFNQNLIDFQMNEPQFQKTVPTQPLIDLRFKNRFSTYQISFNYTFSGRSYRKYYIVFSTPLKAQDSMAFNIRILAGIGSAQNLKLFNMQQPPIFIDQTGLEAEAGQEDIDDINESSEQTDSIYYYTLILLLALILMFLILRLVRRKRQSDMIELVNEISQNNKIEIS